MLNEDYREMLQALLAEKARFLLVGAYALAAHGYPRATMDIDIWVVPSPENAEAVVRAIQRFGAPLHNLTRRDLQRDDTVFQIGVAPRRIDIITGASGLRFEEAFANSLDSLVEGPMQFAQISVRTRTRTRTRISNCGSRIAESRARLGAAAFAKAAERERLFGLRPAAASEVDIEGLQIRVLSLDDLIRNKRASGRTRHLADAEALESLRESKPSNSPDSH